VHPSEQSGATLSRAIPTMAMSGGTGSHGLPRFCLRNVDGFGSAAEQALGPVRSRDHLADQSRGFAAAHPSLRGREVLHRFDVPEVGDVRPPPLQDVGRVRVVFALPHDLAAEDSFGREVEPTNA